MSTLIITLIARRMNIKLNWLSSLILLLIRDICVEYQTNLHHLMVVLQSIHELNYHAVSARGDSATGSVGSC